MLVALTFALALSGPAQAADCTPKPRRDLCQTEVDPAVLTRFGIATAEAEAEAGVEAYRVFFTDGYNRDLPPLAFERRPGSGPTVVVYGPEGERMKGAVASDVWERVVAESRFADRVLAPEPPAADEPAWVRTMPCLHPWSTGVELINTKPDSRSVRRRFENACGGELTTQYAFRLADEAYKALPQCHALDLDRQRNVVTLLATCVSLRGDRVAAAQVRDAIWQGHPNGQRPDAGAWRAWLGTNGSPRLRWGDMEVRTDRGSNNLVAEFLVARMQEFPNLHFYAGRYEGVSSREVVVTGEATYVTGQQPERQWRAPYRQVWVWDPNLSEWMLSDWTMDSFTAAP